MQETTPVCSANDTDSETNTARAMLHTLYRQLGRWDAVAKKLSTEHVKFTKGPLNQIANGKRPVTDKVRAALGLKLRTRPAPVCSVCGEVHVVGWCTTEEGAPRKPAPARKPIDPVKRDAAKRKRMINKARTAMMDEAISAKVLNLTVLDRFIVLQLGNVVWYEKRTDDETEHEAIARAFNNYRKDKEQRDEQANTNTSTSAQASKQTDSATRDQSAAPSTAADAAQ